MHVSVMDWVRHLVKSQGLNEPGLRVLEVGAYNVNGSVRELFNRTDYFGIDLRDGPGVDAVVDICDDLEPTPTYDVVVSTEMLEHCELPQRATNHMVAWLRPGGHLIITTRSKGFPFHDPPDFHRFNLNEIQQLIAKAGANVQWAQTDPLCPGVFVYATKADG